MDINLDAFHFLRPYCLYLIPAAWLLVILWHLLSDPRRRWRGVIAPALLNNLLVDRHHPWRLRPMHVTALALSVLALATAGPTWEQEPPPFSQDTAPLVVLLDLSRSMDAVDIPPTRLERAKQKIRELMRARAGSRTGLVVYAGSAHLVVPPTDDPEFMNTYLDALDTSLMPRQGKAAWSAWQIAGRLLAKESAAGTVLILSDGFETKQIEDFAKRDTRTQLLVLAVGTEQGGPLRSAGGRVALDSGGRPIQGRFDLAALQQLSSKADIPLASLTLDDADIKWVQRRALSHMQAAEERKAQVRWKEAGYYLIYPLLALALWWFRRGWVVRWLPVLLAVVLGMATPPRAYALELPLLDGHRLKTWLADAFLTPDQQGRWHYEHGEYALAAAHFSDPTWQGWAWYQAGDNAAALTAFAHLQTPEAYLMMGNCYARLRDYPHAIGAYDNALKLQPDFAAAKANRALVQTLIPKPKKNKDEPQTDQPNLPPDDVKFDNKGDKGKVVKLNARQMKALNAELWMRNLQTTPADFLRQKFLIEAQQPAAGGKP
ncbi:VWA domain-containing protein [Silvimonas sp. JCM 19000]